MIWTQHHEDALARAYTEPAGSGRITALARQLGVPLMPLYRRRIRARLTKPRSMTDVHWTEPEVAILREHEGRCVTRLRSLLKAEGFERTPAAIRYKLHDLNLDMGQADPEQYSCGDLATLMGVHPSTVRRWCQQEMLGHTVTHGDAGKWYKISRGQVRAFMRAFRGRFDHRKCDGLWMIDILSNERR